MRLRNIKGAEEAIAHSIYVIQDPDEHKEDGISSLGNDHPIHIEIGMKREICSYTGRTSKPEINYYIGIESTPVYFTAP